MQFPIMRVALSLCLIIGCQPLSNQARTGHAEKITIEKSTTVQQDQTKLLTPMHPFDADSLYPNPDLTPDQVVSIQLAALKQNDVPTPDFGIEVAFRFASPENKQVTAPLERFIELVHNPLYAPMLNYDGDERGAMNIAGNRAEQKVVLIDKTGKAASYLFMLSKQPAGEYKDCWMTDGVVRLETQFAASNDTTRKRLSPKEKLDSLSALFAQLKVAKTELETERLQAEIWELWMESGREDIDVLMTKGIEEMSLGNYSRAIDVFNAVTELAPEFAEGWNKRATAHYLNGDFKNSMKDIERTLALEPRHFGAISGLGMIYIAVGNTRGALKAYETALMLSPKQRGLKALVEELRRKLGIREM